MNINHFVTVAALAATALSTTSCRSTLYRAAEAGDIQAVREELKTGADPNGKPSRAQLIWQVPAIVASIPVDVAQVGLTIGTLGVYADVVMKPQEEPFLLSKIERFIHKRAIEVAEENNHLDIVKELVIAGSDARDWLKAKLVSDAARQGDAITLNKLLQQGIDPDWYCSGDYNPLMLAIGGGHEECARLLLNKGAEFTSNVTIGGAEVTCYDYAASMGKIALYNKLGGPIIAPESVKGKTIVFQYTGSEPRRVKYIDESDCRAINIKCGYNEYAARVYRIDCVDQLEFVKYAAYTHPGQWYSDGTIREYHTRNFTSKFEKYSKKCQFPYGNKSTSGFTYSKTGTNTAVLEMEGSSGAFATYLTFDSPTSGYAIDLSVDHISREATTHILIEKRNIRFTIK